MARGWLLLALAGCAHWSRKDTALEASFAAVTTIDWGQSNELTADCMEANPAIGGCGQRMPVGLYFPIALVAHAAVSAVLPPSWRTVFQAATAGMETTTVWWNSRALSERAGQ